MNPSDQKTGWRVALNLGGAFRERVWLDRYLGFASLFTLLVGLNALSQGGFRRALLWIGGAILLVLLAPRPGIVGGGVFGFIALQSLVNSAIHHYPRGLLIALIAFACSLLAVAYASRSGERWPEGSTDYGVAGIGIDAAALLLLLWLLIQLT